jgi:hypothetical protein
LEGIGAGDFGFPLSTDVGDWTLSKTFHLKLTLIVLAVFAIYRSEIVIGIRAVQTLSSFSESYSPAWRA